MAIEIKQTCYAEGARVAGPPSRRNNNAADEAHKSPKDAVAVTGHPLAQSVARLFLEPVCPCPCDFSNHWWCLIVNRTITAPIPVFFQNSKSTTEIYRVTNATDNQLWYEQDYSNYYFETRIIFVVFEVKLTLVTGRIIVLHGNTPPRSDVRKIIHYIIRKNSISQLNDFRHVYASMRDDEGGDGPGGCVLCADGDQHGRPPGNCHRLDTTSLINYRGGVEILRSFTRKMVLFGNQGNIFAPIFIAEHRYRNIYGQPK
ncbi:hypothetical protein QTP88_022454 [Uroleucon formosanum]